MSRDLLTVDDLTATGAAAHRQERAVRASSGPHCSRSSSAWLIVLCADHRGVDVHHPGRSGQPVGRRVVPPAGPVQPQAAAGRHVPGTGIAMLVAAPDRHRRGHLPVGVCPPRVRRVLKPGLEILAGVPSVVLGFFAITVISPDLVQTLFTDASQFNLHGRRHRRRHPHHPAGGVGERGRDAGRARGRSARRPTASGPARSPPASGSWSPRRCRASSPRSSSPSRVRSGETMVVFIAGGSGGGSLFTLNPLEPGTTMTAAMASQATGTDQVRGEGLTFQSLFFVGLLLFVMTLLLNLVADRFVRKVRQGLLGAGMSLLTPISTGTPTRWSGPAQGQEGRLVGHRSSRALLLLALLTSFLVLGVLLLDVLQTGWPVLSTRLGDFLTSPLRSLPEEAGVYQGLVGSFWIAVMVAVIAFPLGHRGRRVPRGVRAEEPVHNFININIRNLAGVPSIVYGILGLAMFVQALERRHRRGHPDRGGHHPGRARAADRDHHRLRGDPGRARQPARGRVRGRRHPVGGHPSPRRALRRPRYPHRHRARPGPGDRRGGAADPGGSHHRPARQRLPGSSTGAAAGAVHGHADHHHRVGRATPTRVQGHDRRPPSW